MMQTMKNLGQSLGDRTYKPRLPGQIITFEARAEANEVVDRQTRYQQIIYVYKCCNDFGLTVRECAMLMFLKKYTRSEHRQEIAPRITELRAMGILEEDGKTKDIDTNRNVTVFKLSEDWEKRWNGK